MRDIQRAGSSELQGEPKLSQLIVCACLLYSAPATQNTWHSERTPMSRLVHNIYAKTAPRPPITRIKKTQQVRSPNILLRPSLSFPMLGQTESMSEPIAWHQPQPQGDLA